MKLNIWRVNQRAGWCDAERSPSGTGVRRIFTKRSRIVRKWLARMSHELRIATVRKRGWHDALAEDPWFGEWRVIPTGLFR